MEIFEPTERVPIWMVVAASISLAFWGIGLGFGFMYLRHEHYALAAFSGAAGALVMAISHLQLFVRSCWHQRHNPQLSTANNKRKLFMWSPSANLLVKPFLWPLADAIVGSIAVALFYDKTTDVSKVVGLAGVSGAGWFALAQRWERRG